MSIRSFSAALLIGAAVFTMTGSAAWAQDAPNPNPAPGGTDQTTPDAGTGPLDSGTVEQGAGSQSDSSTGMVADEEVFGFDFTAGPTGLTTDQLTAARNTCNQDITSQPMRYSPAVKTFCEQIR